LTDSLFCEYTKEEDPDEKVLIVDEQLHAHGAEIRILERSV
jgi:hypothetical protein